MTRPRVLSAVALIFSATLYLGCNPSTPSGMTGTGGKAGSSAGGSRSGGASGSGGSLGLGGASSAGGSVATGGNSGGASGSGGDSSTGGSVASGGTSGTGGTSGFGGTAGSGGVASGGGSQGTGGSLGSGGGSGKLDAGIIDHPDTGLGGAVSTGGSGSGGTGGKGSGGTTGGGGTSSSFWPSAYTATTGASGMNTGQDCMSSCHNHGFALGGTVYDSSGKPKSQVQVGIKLTSGQFVSVFSGSDGNFHYSGSGLNLGGADIRVRDSSGELQMPVTSTSSGACNSCHTGTGTPRISAP